MINVVYLIFNATGGVNISGVGCAKAGYSALPLKVIFQLLQKGIRRHIELTRDENSKMQLLNMLN